MDRAAEIVSLRQSLQNRKLAAEPAKGVMDIAAIVCAGVPGLGIVGAIIDKAAERIGPDIEKAIIDLAGLTASLANGLDAIENDQARIQATLDTIARNQALQDRLVEIAAKLTEGSVATIASSNGATQTFRDVVFANLRLDVSATSGASNHLSGVRQYGDGASFVADRGDNVVEGSEFHGASSSVSVDRAALRSVDLNTPQAAVVVTATGRHSVGLQIGGYDDGSAAMFIPSPNRPRRPL